MADTYFISRETFPTASAVYADDAVFGRFFLSDRELGNLFSWNTSDARQTRGGSLIINMAPEGQPARLVRGENSKRVVARIVSKKLTEKRQAAEAAHRKNKLVEAGRRIRTDFDVDKPAMQAERTAPQYDSDSDPLAEFLADEIMRPGSPLAIAIANA